MQNGFTIESYKEAFAVTELDILIFNFYRILILVFLMYGWWTMLVYNKEMADIDFKIEKEIKNIEIKSLKEVEENILSEVKDIKLELITGRQEQAYKKLNDLEDDLVSDIMTLERG